MILFKKIIRNFLIFLSHFVLINSCGIWDPADARKVSPMPMKELKKI